MICTSITATDAPQAHAMVKQAVAGGADAVELRLDLYDEFTDAALAAADRESLLRELIASATVPVIVTYRPAWEGGEFKGDETARLQLLAAAGGMGATYIDVELDAFDAFAAVSGAPVSASLILSHHNYEQTLALEELQELERRMRHHGADVAKIVMTANSIVDAKRMIDLLEASTGPMISLSMGERGVITRILAAKHGAHLTFAALAAGRESAPGQPSLEQLARLYRFREHGRGTRVFGIIGNPVAHSKSPLLHNTALAAAGVDAVYVPMLVDDMDAFLAAYSTPDWAGFSVTIPHKEAAHRLSEPDEVAARIGAVNTLVRTSSGGLQGFNTDWRAAVDAIERGLQAGVAEGGLAGLTAVVLGAGGAARALAYGARHRGAAVVIAARNVEKAEALAAEIGAGEGPAVRAVALADAQAGQLDAVDVVINSTPLGMAGKWLDETPFPMEMLEKYKPLVFDAVYAPLETRLLREALAAGCCTVDGLEMFVGQAEAQFQYFTGQEPEPGLMRSTMLAAIA